MVDWRTFDLNKIYFVLDRKMNRRTKYYHAHKDEEEFMERNRKQRRESYARNAEKERAKALERYYAKKALAKVPEQAELPISAIPEVSPEPAGDAEN